MKEILKKKWDYTLFEKNQEYFLTVICGSVALYEIMIKLDEKERDDFKKSGKDSIEILVGKIQNNPNVYSSRKIILNE